MLPAQQRFHTHNAVATQGHLRLVVQHELVVLQRLAQVQLHIQRAKTPVGTGGLGCLERLVTLKPRLLLRIHGLVEQRFGFLAVLQAQ